LELEVKLRVRDPERAREVIKGLAQFAGEAEEEDVYFNFDCVGGCCRNFAETDEAVRLRRRGDRCFLTYKGPKKVVEGVKGREEIETEVGSCEKLKAFLEKLCLKPVAVVRKKREYWKAKGATITLDYVEGLGYFVEIESEGAGPEELKELASLFPDAEVVEKTYLEMLLESGH